MYLLKFMQKINPQIENSKFNAYFVNSVIYNLTNDKQDFMKMLNLLCFTIFLTKKLERDISTEIVFNST